MEIKNLGVVIQNTKAKNNLPESLTGKPTQFANTNGGKIIISGKEKKTLTYQKKSIDPAKYYEASKQLTDTRFKRCWCSAHDF